MEDNLLNKYKQSLKSRLLIRRVAYCFFAVMFALSVLAFYMESIHSSGLVLSIGVARLFIWGLPLLFITIKKEELLKKDQLNPKKEMYATYYILEKELEDKKNQIDSDNEVDEIKKKTEELKKQLEE
jgi:hypothetical protein